MAASSKDSDAKAMDVAKPGKTMPDTTARPVIVTHRPMVQDPTVKTDDKPAEPTGKEATETDKAKISSGAHGDKVIQPVSESLNTEEPSKPEETDDTSEKTADDSDASAEAAVVEAVVEQAESSGKKDGKPSEEDKAKQDNLQKLVANKTYFVPIGQVARRRNRRLSVTLLVLLLLLAGGYLAIDAGVTPFKIKLPIDLIRR